MKSTAGSSLPICPTAVRTVCTDCRSRRDIISPDISDMITDRPFRYANLLKTLLKIQFLSRALCHCWRSGQVLKDVNQCQAIEKEAALQQYVQCSGPDGGGGEGGATKPKSQEERVPRSRVSVFGPHWCTNKVCQGLVLSILYSYPGAKRLVSWNKKCSQRTFYLIMNEIKVRHLLWTSFNHCRGPDIQIASPAPLHIYWTASLPTNLPASCFRMYHAVWRKNVIMRRDLQQIIAEQRIIYAATTEFRS